MLETSCSQIDFRHGLIKEGFLKLADSLRKLIVMEESRLVSAIISNFEQVLPIMNFDCGWQSNNMEKGNILMRKKTCIAWKKKRGSR